MEKKHGNIHEKQQQVRGSKVRKKYNKHQHTNTINLLISCRVLSLH